jgi:hypothetical protein
MYHFTHGRDKRKNPHPPHPGLAMACGIGGTDPRRPGRIHLGTGGTGHGLGLGLVGGTGGEA